MLLCLNSPYFYIRELNLLFDFDFLRTFFDNFSSGFYSNTDFWYIAYQAASICVHILAYLFTLMQCATTNASSGYRCVPESLRDPLVCYTYTLVTALRLAFL